MEVCAIAGSFFAVTAVLISNYMNAIYLVKTTRSLTALWQLFSVVSLTPNILDVPKLRAWYDYHDRRKIAGLLWCCFVVCFGCCLL